MDEPMLNLEINPEPQRGRTAVVSLTVPAIGVLALLMVLIGLRDGTEGALARLADLLPVSYAFAAGMVASVNPCGILMLPSYVMYHLGTAADDNRRGIRRLLKSVRLALVVTASFTTVFALVGAVVATGGQWLASVFPVAGLLIGMAMAALGIWLLLGKRTLGVAAAGRLRIAPARTLGNMFLFGVVFAIGSLSCTLPVFLVVVGGALAGGSAAAGFGQFLGYALGMGAVILAVTVGTALFRGAIARWLDRLTPYVHRFSALFLIGAGGYLVFYWVFIAGLA